MIVASESFGALLASKSFGRQLIVLVPGQHVGPQMVLLRELLGALQALERSDFLMHRRDMLGQVIFTGEAIVTNDAFPVTFLFLPDLAVLGDDNARCRCRSGGRRDRGG